ncbi:MotA/TolQ/ExbB proton channel family protein, partial [Vibrio parahaemolyticus]
MIICSAITVLIIAERLFQLFISIGVGKSAIRQQLASLDPTNSRDIEALADELSGKRPLLYRGVAMLLSHHSFAISLS